MPRPKIPDVNEGVGEALFYPYNAQVNKCSGSCNTLDNFIEKLCVPNVIKGLNMKVYNFLTMLNETRNVLWHESCKCVCKLNSSVCNNKQIWNSNTCRCDCNEDFAGIINCAKGYTWNPSICECQCDTWCKLGQYLDHKNCVCKNKLVGRLISECTSVMNETVMNNNDNNNDNFYKIMAYVFIGLFLLAIICFCVFAYFQIKNYIKINMLIISYKMDIESLQIKNKHYYDCDDIIIYNFDFDIGSIKIFKRESKIDVNIYYIGYKPDIDDTITPLFFFC